MPCLVKSVLRQYRLLNGFPVAPLEYNNELSLVSVEYDFEY